MTKIHPFDERRDVVVPGDHSATLQYCVNHFIQTAQECIEKQGYFAVALSGGSTPKEIYKNLALPHFKKLIDWSRVLLFWSDERDVPPNYADSNYNMAMLSGLQKTGLPSNNIFRMQADTDIEKHALIYDELIKTKIPKKRFDMVMLGMGLDGHTASLFPETEGLIVEEQLAVANWIPKKSNWRMTLTYQCINSADEIVLYVMGKKKAPMVKLALTGEYNPDLLPVQKVGTRTHKALWIIDEEAAQLLVSGLRA